MSGATLLIQRSAALRAARKRLQFRGDKEMNENLEVAAGSLAEAYKIGAEEAQREILQRLAELPIVGAGR